MKRHLLIDFLVLCLTLLAGLVWSNSDQSNYANLLRHGGLSEQALVYKSNSAEHVSTAVAKLNANKKLKNYQVHFAVNGHLTYFFGKGNYASVPVVSGNMMTSRDFQASLPVAVVGQNVAAKAYSTASQKYLKLKGQYLPIIGVVGTRGDNRLNDQIFISASSERHTLDPALKDVEILVDGADAQHTTIFSRIFGGAKPQRILYSNAQNHKGWWQRNAVTILATTGILALMVLVGMLAAFMMPRPQTDGLDGALRNHYLGHLTRHYLAGVSVSLIIGTLISWSRFYMTNHFRLLVFVGLMFIAFAMSHQLFIRRRSAKEDFRAVTK